LEKLFKFDAALGLPPPNPRWIDSVGWGSAPDLVFITP